MNWLLLLLALALSVPVGSATLTLGALALEFVLGLLVEAGEGIESDPAKKRTATVVLLILLGGALFCLCVACVVAVALSFSPSHGGILGFVQVLR